MEKELIVTDDAMRINLNINEDIIKEINDLDLEINKNQKTIQRYNALKRLMQNEDFINVIINGFVKERSQDVLEQLILPSNKRTRDKQSCDSVLEAIAMLNEYIGVEGMNGDLHYEAIRAKEMLDDINSSNIYEELHNRLRTNQ